jgi:phosphoribosylaminoimidazole carboxylase (NCAIR synthetase)
MTAALETHDGLDAERKLAAHALGKASNAVNALARASEEVRVRFNQHTLDRMDERISVFLADPRIKAEDKARMRALADDHAKLLAEFQRIERDCAAALRQLELEAPDLKRAAQRAARAEFERLRAEFVLAVAPFVADEDEGRHLAEQSSRLKLVLLNSTAGYLGRPTVADQVAHSLALLSDRKLP